MARLVTRGPRLRTAALVAGMVVVEVVVVFAAGWVVLTKGLSWLGF